MAETRQSNCIKEIIQTWCDVKAWMSDVEATVWAVWVCWSVWLLVWVVLGLCALKRAPPVPFQPVRPNERFTIEETTQLRSSRTIQQCRTQERAHMLRVKTDAAALESDEQWANIGDVRVTCRGHNPERVIGWIVLLYELPCLVSLPLVVSNVWHSSADGIRTVVVSTSVTVEWGSEQWVLGSLMIFVVLVIIAWLLRVCGRFVWVQSAIIELMYVRIVCRCASIAVCSDHDGVLLLPSIGCGSSRHIVLLLVVGMLFIALYSLTLLHTLTSKESRRPAFRYQPRFNIVVTMAKTIVTGATVLFQQWVPVHLLAGMSLTMLLLLVCNYMMVPCHGRGRRANNLRTVTFALSLWCALCGLVSSALAPTNACMVSTCFGGFWLIGCLAWCINDRRAVRCTIPSLPMLDLLSSKRPYVREVACCTLAQNRFPTREYTTPLIKILMKMDLDVSTRLWASIALLRGERDRCTSNLPSRIQQLLHHNRVLPFMGVDLRYSTHVVKVNNTVSSTCVQLLEMILCNSDHSNLIQMLAAKAVVMWVQPHEITLQAWILAHTIHAAFTDDASTRTQCLIVVSDTLTNETVNIDDSLVCHIAYLVSSLFSMHASPLLFDWCLNKAAWDLSSPPPSLSSFTAILDILIWILPAKLCALTIIRLVDQLVDAGLLLSYHNSTQSRVERLVCIGRTHYPTRWESWVSRIRSVRQRFALVQPIRSIQSISDHLLVKDVPFVLHTISCEERSILLQYVRAESIRHSLVESDFPHTLHP